MSKKCDKSPTIKGAYYVLTKLLKIAFTSLVRVISSDNYNRLTNVAIIT